MPDNLASDKIFLNRLTAIVEANLSNNQFGVSKLAKEFGRSRSYIHRRLKLLTNESGSSFICKMRLEQALEMLQKDEATVAEIAYNVGFSSPSYFNKCFRDEFGYAPGEYKKVTYENDTIKSKVSVEVNKSVQNHSKRNRTIKTVFIAFLVILVLVSPVFYKTFIKSELTKSIAVLPLKNTGNDEETQILADGIMEDILNRLSHIQDLKVKSRLSAEKFSSPDMAMHDIARKMGVSYVLEGTIIKENNTVRIYIQLIEAKADYHVWSKQYDRDLSGIFAFVTDVSMQIADELKIVLLPEEIKHIEKVYTANAEAYRLYQKGRFFWQRRTEEDINKSIEYFNEALSLDSTYALAYAGLADAFFISAWWKWYPQPESYAKSKVYALKALELDNSLAEAHATLGGIACWWDHNWEVAEKELKQAIELNPNCADANQYYSEYYDIFGKDSLARIYINKSIELNPNSKIKYYESSLYYYNEGNMDKALKEGKKALELDRSFKKQNFKNFIIYIRKEESNKAIDSLLKFFVSAYPEEDYAQHLNNVYKELGLSGVIRFTIEKLLQNSKVDHFIIAQLYALLYDKKSTIAYLNKALFTSSQIPRIKNCLDFRFISDEPEFHILLESLYLPKD